jgi:hypothetical protein
MGRLNLQKDISELMPIKLARDYEVVKESSSTPVQYRHTITI